MRSSTDFERSVPGSCRLMISRLPPAWLSNPRVCTGWVFCPSSLQPRPGRTVQHQRPSAGRVSRSVFRIGKSAGIRIAIANEEAGQPAEYASAHDLRRSCAERLRSAGVPPLTIAHVMRHSSFVTTLRYYAPGDVQQEAVDLRRILSGGDAGS